MLKGKTILIGVGGGISAYKIPNLVSMLKKDGADVNVIMTKNAVNFITPLTFETLCKDKCYTDTFDRDFSYEVEHISLAAKADIFVIAPATADLIAKAAHGIADDMLTTTFLACDRPKLIVPAMNTGMYENPVTQDNIALCRKYGYTVMEPATGPLACGGEGKGRMPEPEEIYEAICQEIEFDKDLSGKKVLVTAGPTEEAIDPVRFISNHSTGLMGFEIARAAARRGASVTLVHGPCSLTPPYGVNTVPVVSARDMFEAVKDEFPDSDIIIMAAAVADYRPVEAADEKIKKNDSDLTLRFERTDDILSWLGSHRKEGQYICGFSMETQNLIENSRKKLTGKNVDLIAANSLKTEGAGFGTDTNVLTLITKDEDIELPLMTKYEAAVRLLDEITGSF